jgi:hypothetical protein
MNKVKDQVMGYRLIKANGFMKVNGIMINEMEMDIRNMVTEIVTKASPRIINLMEMVSILGQTVKLMTANGKLEVKMAMAFGMG